MPQRIKEFHSIMPIGNVPSVMEYGILCYDKAKRLPHASIADEDVQSVRDGKSVTGGLALHKYANLYLDARNPMMYRRKDQAEDNCVLRVDLSVKEMDGFVYSDHNAASRFARFLSRDQEHMLNCDDIFAKYWNHPDDPVRYEEHKHRKCAEALVPHCVPESYIKGAYVVNRSVDQKLKTLGFELDVKVHPYLFFK